MPSYRFCRPDDLALIVNAINTCYQPHYPQQPAVTSELLKEQMTLFGLRPGNCMVALEHRQPIGVVISCKRDYGAWIQALGCQTAHQRQGIAAQLVEALIRKIAIQGAPDITVDVREENTVALQFFTSMGFQRRQRYVSYQGSLTARSQDGYEVGPVAMADVVTQYAACHMTAPCWERHVETLAAYGETVQSYGCFQQDIMQGYVVNRGHTILDVGLLPSPDMLAVSAALLGHLYLAGITEVTLAKMPVDDPLCPVLEQYGLVPTAFHILMGQPLA